MCWESVLGRGEVLRFRLAGLILGGGPKFHFNAFSGTALGTVPWFIWIHITSISCSILCSLSALAPDSRNNSVKLTYLT